MAGKRWTAQEDDIVRTTFWMKDATAIADLLPGRTTKAVHHRAKVLGLKKSPRDRGRIASFKWRRELEQKLGEAVCDWLGRRYIDEEATYRQLTAEVGINTRSLMKLMRFCGIRPISPREAVLRQMIANPAFLIDMQAAAHTESTQCKLALSRQEHWAERQSPAEFSFLLALRGAWFSPVPEMAVERFNIDFAFPRQMLAVELDPPWHHSPSKREADARKDQRLGELGWTVLRLDSRTSTSFNVRKVSDALTSLAFTQPR